jgi:hypothetical protein
MNEVENDDIKIVINLNENNHDDVLNARISQAEIENAILIIRNDKSSGHFCLLCLHISSSHGRFTDLFNFVGRKVPKEFFSVLSKRSLLK